jgi:hypothetical protein
MAAARLVCNPPASRWRSPRGCEAARADASSWVLRSMRSGRVGSVLAACWSLGGTARRVGVQATSCCASLGFERQRNVSGARCCAPAVRRAVGLRLRRPLSFLTAARTRQSRSGVQRPERVNLPLGEGPARHDRQLHGIASGDREARVAGFLQAPFPAMRHGRRPQDRRSQPANPRVAKGSGHAQVSMIPTGGQRARVVSLDGNRPCDGDLDRDMGARHPSDAGLGQALLHRARFGTAGVDDTQSR